MAVGLGRHAADLAKRIPGTHCCPTRLLVHACHHGERVTRSRVAMACQIGQEKGGFYSYAWLENLFGRRIVNAAEINPEWQDVDVGDAVRLHPKTQGLPVRLAEKDRALAFNKVSVGTHTFHNGA